MSCGTIRFNYPDNNLCRWQCHKLCSAKKANRFQSLTLTLDIFKVIFCIHRHLFLTHTLNILCKFLQSHQKDTSWAMLCLFFSYMQLFPLNQNISRPSILCSTSCKKPASSSLEKFLVLTIAFAETRNAALCNHHMCCKCLLFFPLSHISRKAEDIGFFGHFSAILVGEWNLNYVPELRRQLL